MTVDDQQLTPARRRWEPSQLRSLAMPIVAVLAIGIAVAAWFHGSQGTASLSYSDQQTAQAKKTMCSAFATVRRGVVTNTNLENPHDSDAGRLAVAANARLALLGGGSYLRARLFAAPATPADLASPIRDLATTIEQLGINYLADASDFVQDPLRRDVDSQLNQISGLCK